MGIEQKLMLTGNGQTTTLNKMDLLEAVLVVLPDVCLLERLLLLEDDSERFAIDC